MGNQIYYTTARGNSEVKDFIEELDAKATKGNVRAKYDVEQITYAMERIKDGPPHMGPLRGGVKELRPGRWRIIYFEWEGSIVLLTCFRKETNQTPDHEIDRAISRKKDWMNRHDN
ncbi:type II toxin-antitoxin system RelE/ParE family toxin [Saccharibacillus sacchari]|uniref:Type II toxin-antitoxin system RelE/ParE family toxin n=1 Tax=Saccharibacillus sacchari TaxID=456493 RepID=A0ACC6PIA0_9BACL